MLRVFILVCLVALAQCQQGGSLDDLIGSVFNPSNGGNGNAYPLTPPQPTKKAPLPGGNPGRPVNPNPTSVLRPKPVLNPCPEGECVPYHLCANGSIITTGEGLIDIRFGEENGQTPEHPCPGSLETCCHERGAPQIPITPTPVNQGCGFRNIDGVGFRITGDKDNEAQFGEFPWTVAILKEERALDKVLNVYQCGGALIHPSVVLTAAHCVYGKPAQALKVRAGEWDTQSKDEIFPHQDRNVVDFVVHEQYYKGGLFNDVALLFLSEPVQIAENVNTICLPPQDYNFDYERCFASGWGKDLFSKAGKYQVILKRVELPIVPHDQCQSSLRTTRLGTHFELHPSFTCAGGETGKDTCKGDGGSPLVCPIKGTVHQYFQAGIVAWGIGCGETNTPGVYVSVSKFRDWIDAKVQAKTFHPSAYSHV